MTFALAVTPYTDGDFEAVTAIWFDSAVTMGIPMPVTLVDLRARWLKELADGWEVFVGRQGAGPIAFIALKPGKVDQLFVAPACQGQGAGKLLLDLAKIRMPGGFHLTTAVAGRAHNFYVREGLVRGEISRHRFGHEIVRYDWQP